MVPTFKLPACSRVTGKPECELKAVGMIVLKEGRAVRPCAPSRVAYEVEAGRQQTVRSPRTMDPHSQEWHRNREATSPLQRRSKGLSWMKGNLQAQF